MAEGSTNTADMLAVHGTLRREIDGLSDLVAGVPAGDADRAAVVADHYRLVTTLLGVHHHGEDEILWPLLARDPEGAALGPLMQEQHAELDAVLETTGPAAERFAVSGDPASAALLSAGLAELSAAVDAHFAQEEATVLPVAARALTQEEWDSLGDHARSSLADDPQRMFLVLGMIVDANPPEVGAHMLADMPPPAQEAWATVGEPAYRAYRARLDGAG